MLLRRCREASQAYFEPSHTQLLIILHPYKTASDPYCTLIMYAKLIQNKCLSAGHGTDIALDQLPFPDEDGHHKDLNDSRDCSSWKPQKYRLVENVRPWLAVWRIYLGSDKLFSMQEAEIIKIGPANTSNTKKLWPNSKAHGSRGDWRLPKKRDTWFSILVRSKGDQCVEEDCVQRKQSKFRVALTRSSWQWSSPIFRLDSWMSLQNLEHTLPYAWIMLGILCMIRRCDTLIMSHHIHPLPSKVYNSPSPTMIYQLTVLIETLQATAQNLTQPTSCRQEDKWKERLSGLVGSRKKSR